MKYGYFDDKAKEYVITTPHTPLPWINYLGSNDFFSLISNTCGGYSFYKDAKLMRITRYRYNNIPVDSNGKYYYINDDGVIWNPGTMPSMTETDTYECRHGLGYSRFHSSKNKLEADLLAFVPSDAACEINCLAKWKCREAQFIIKQNTEKEEDITASLLLILRFTILIQAEMLFSALVMEMLFRKLYVRKNAAIP